MAEDITQPDLIVEQTPTTEAAGQPGNGMQILKARIKAWPLARKLALLGVTLASLALFGFIIVSSRTADYQMLFGNLSDSDAAGIVEWLKANKVPFQLKSNGHTILVPSSKVHETRLNLASSGLPEGGGIGFEIFDKQSFALTDFVQKVNYTRALQGELARTVASLGPVESARVHLAIPEKRLFKNQQKPATASIILKLRPGRRLNQAQVEGIVHLVSSAIEGLAPEHVTVIDQNGKVLSKNDSKALAGQLSSELLEYQLQVERHLEDRAQALLDRAVGPKNGMVRVTADLDFARKEKTEEIFDPEEPVIRSEQVNEEKSGSEISGGIPGVQANLQGNGQSKASASPPTSRTQRTTNYEISKTIAKTVDPVGNIKKISVAVLIADKQVPATKKEAAKTVPRTPEELASIKKMISSALGLDANRGDQIEITSMPFSPTAQEADTEAASPPALYTYMPLIRYLLLGIGALLVYLLLARPVVKTMRTEVTTHFKTVEELQAEEERKKIEAQQQELEALAMDPLIRVREEIRNNPIFTAHILKSWIHENG